MKKKHGWIIQWLEEGFVNQDGNAYTKYLCSVLVFDTRAKARCNSLGGDSAEVVRKVELFKNGKAKKIIPGR